MSEKIRIGIIHRHNFTLTDSADHDWEFANFTLGAEAISFWKIFDSAFATPSRYIQEIFRRLFRLQEGGESSAKFVFNPLFEANWLSVAQVLAALAERTSYQDIFVMTDQNGLPAGYLFPSWFDIDDSHFLTLLSAVDGGIDAGLCRRLFSCEVQCISVARLPLDRVQHNNFVYEANKGIYRWTAERAMAILEPLAGLPPAEAALRRNAIPFTAVMPHHAGDALFFALAWKGSSTHIKRLAINKAYCDIVAETAPELILWPIVQPPANRSDEIRQGKVTPEHEYFLTFRDVLPSDSFYYYCRPSRDYNLTRLHMIDHYAFALGRQSCAMEHLLSRRRMPVPSRPAIPAKPVRVLLHFDAGWPLKIYPNDAQEKLIDLLHLNGYEITVLAGMFYEHPKCRVTTFQDYTSFKKLVKSHHILVGMDSFPSHYAAHVLGLPTICLFGCTRPENSDAPGAANYARLEEGLPCRPCYGIARCPLDGNPRCYNFVSPETVVAVVNQMVERVRKEEESKPWAPVFETEERCRPDPMEQPVKVKRISLRLIRLKAALTWTVLPYLTYLSLPYREFVAAVRMDGFLIATLRALRFLRRVLSGRARNQNS